jgi:hypothetical protein
VNNEGRESLKKMDEVDPSNRIVELIIGSVFAGLIFTTLTITGCISVCI